MLIIILTLTCFEQTGQILGREQQSVISLILQPQVDSEPLCQASDNIEAIAILNYNGKKTETKFIFKKDIDNSILFDLSADISTFTEIFKTNVISYQINLAGSLQVKGPIQTINLVRLNTSACWENLKLVYSRSFGQEFIQMTGMPLLCEITNPIITFRFASNNQQKQIRIMGSSDGNEYYSSTGIYDYSQITFYKQELSTLITDEDKQSMKDFFTEFETNRDLRVSFVFITDAYQIRAQIDIIESSNTKCLLNLNPDVFIASRYVDIGLDNNKYSTDPDCVSMPVTFRQHAIARTNMGVFHAAILKQTKDDFNARGGVDMSFDHPIPSFHEVTTADLFYYLTSYDLNGNILLETSYQGPLALSCIDYFATIVSQIKGGCVIINFYNTEQCLSRKVQELDLIFTSQINGFTSRTTFFSFHLQIVPSPNILQYCSVKTTGIIYGNDATQKTYYDRIIAYANIIRKQQPIYVALSGKQEFFNWYGCNLDIGSNIIFQIVGISIGIAILIGILIFRQSRQLFQ
ncbi:hypothetical protein SS50377_27933 [Spironucleus salmonicida]|uniref:Transmembrane protein n=1 Tax=Spironucleus salmonicida TaxID=348837 RepID=V6LDB2_9EUKA|nr:hypothetical protein SS50377_27933 [Spironucleus salmonicida]|eukprot:EST42495.1 Hypothetical protein SS50377_17801 [Spironucleus salmonicida]